MANHRDDAGRWLGRVAAALVLVPALGLSARADAPDDKASEVIKAFKQLQAAVRNDVRDGARGVARPPPRSPPAPRRRSRRRRSTPPRSTPCWRRGWRPPRRPRPR